VSRFRLKTTTQIPDSPTVDTQFAGLSFGKIGSGGQPLAGAVFRLEDIDANEAGYFLKKTYGSNGEVSFSYKLQSMQECRRGTKLLFTS
jgi:hypothetical protein